MWQSAISSDRLSSESASVARRPRRCGSLRTAAGLLSLLILGSAAALEAKVFLTVEEALELAFPGCGVDRRTVFLTDEQLAAARDLAGTEIDKALVYPYDAVCGGEPAGTAYFDTHRVRTLAETVMVAVDRQGRVQRTEILAFREPEDYIPRGVWYQQFLGQELDDELDLKREIHGVTGATLTARAMTDAVRRVLALHRVLEGTP